MTANVSDVSQVSLSDGPHPNGASHAAGPRPLRRRRGLPNSRAMVGGVLVAAAAVGLFAAYLRVNSGPGESFVVARRPLSAGSRLEASDLALAPMRLPPSLRSRVFAEVSVVAGATLLSPLDAGELVQASGVVTRQGAAPNREVAFPVDGGHLSPNLREGERVDVLATFGTANEAATSMVLRHALVVGLARDRTGLGGPGSTVVTLALEQPADEPAMAHAVQLAKLTVVRATGVPPDAGPTPTYRPTPTGGTPVARATGQ